MRILRLLSSRPLPCGCVAGIYETYSGPLVWILDCRDEACHDPRHRPGAVVSAGDRREPSGVSRLPSPGWVR
jgi:hypothetical protein